MKTIQAFRKKEEPKTRTIIIMATLIHATLLRTKKIRTLVSIKIVWNIANSQRRSTL